MLSVSVIKFPKLDASLFDTNGYVKYCKLVSWHYMVLQLLGTHLNGSKKLNYFCIYIETDLPKYAGKQNVNLAF